MEQTPVDRQIDREKNIVALSMASADLGAVSLGEHQPPLATTNFEEDSDGILTGGFLGDILPEDQHAVL